MFAGHLGRWHSNHDESGIIARIKRHETETHVCSKGRFAGAPLPTMSRERATSRSIATVPALKPTQGSMRAPQCHAAQISFTSSLHKRVLG